MFWFDTTPRISTYIYAIVAGPFGYHESLVDDMPPMRIYARQSLVKDISHKDMFLATQEGIRYYQDLFGA